MYKRIIFLVTGSLVMGAGIALCLQSGYGMDPLAVFVQGISHFFEVPFGYANYAVYLSIASLAFLLERKQVTIITFLSPFVTSLAIELVLKQTMMQGPLILLVLGLCGLSLGIALTITADFGKSCYDAFLYAMMNKMQRDYATMRWLFDLLFLLVGFLLKGTIGIGTLLSFLLVGKMVQFLLALINGR